MIASILVGDPVTTECRLVISLSSEVGQTKDSESRHSTSKTVFPMVWLKFGAALLTAKLLYVWCCERPQNSLRWVE